MVDTDIIVATVTPSSPFDRLPLDFGDPGPTDLDRLAAILDYLTLCCGKLAPDEPGQQLAAEAMAEHKRLLAGATAATREQLSRCGAGQNEADEFSQPTAATTRWRVSVLLSTPLPVPSIGRARWGVELVRCRGAESATFEVEACDAEGRLALASALAYRPTTATQARM